MLNLARTFGLLSTFLIVGCTVGPSGMSFDSPVGEWSDKYEKKNGGYGTSKITIIDETKATYTYPPNGRIEFYAIDEPRIWKGFWILEYGANACAEEKDGSPFWGVSIFRFNETYNRYSGSWDVCGQGPKYTTSGIR